MSVGFWQAHRLPEWKASAGRFFVQSFPVSVIPYKALANRRAPWKS